MVRSLCSKHAEAFIAMTHIYLCCSYFISMYLESRYDLHMYKSPFAGCCATRQRFRYLLLLSSHQVKSNLFLKTIIRYLRHRIAVSKSEQAKCVMMMWMRDGVISSGNTSYLQDVICLLYFYFVLIILNAFHSLSF